MQLVKGQELLKHSTRVYVKKRRDGSHTEWEGVSVAEKMKLRI